MKVKLVTLSLLLLNLTVAFAEEHEAAHHEPSIWDLKYPALNFVILVGFMVWKLKKPLADMFDKKADDVKTLMESAEKQSKDANQKLQELESKIKNIDSELVKINGDYESDVVSFAKNQSTDTQTVIARMRRDVESKLEGEKKELNDELKHDVLNLVVAKTKNTIGSNTELKTKATNNILVGLK